MTSTTVDASARQSSGSARDRQHDWSSPAAPATQAPGAAAAYDETFSPARATLPWALLVLLLSAVAVGYAVVLGVGDYLTGTLVLVAAVLGGVIGLAVRGARERRISAGRALGDGLRRLGRVLWS